MVFLTAEEINNLIEKRDYYFNLLKNYGEDEVAFAEIDRINELLKDYGY